MRDLVGAVEGGGTKFLCAVGTGPQDLIDEKRIETRDPISTLARVTEFFWRHRERLRGIGVCTFGALELNPHAGERHGALLTTPKPGWSRFPLRQTLSRSLGVPVSIETDVNGAALAEQAWGRGQSADPMIYVTVGTGIGVGAVIHGGALHGILHPELGHARVPRAPRDTFRGVCPFHGDCAEGMASATALRARTGSEPHALSDSDPVWALEAHYLGALLHNIVLAYAPERIVLGGGVLQRQSLWPKVYQALLASLGGYLPRAESTQAGIAGWLVPSGLSGRAGLWGGFAVAMRASDAMPNSKQGEPMSENTPC